MNTDVEDLLRQGMARFDPDAQMPAGVAARARLQLRRRRARTGLAGVAAASVTAAAVAVAIMPAGSGGGHRVPVQTDAYVVAHVESALTAAGRGGRIMVASVQGTGRGQRVIVQFWRYGDQAAKTVKGAGRVDEASGYRVTGRTVHLTLVDYHDRTWWQLTAPWYPAPAFAQNGCAGPAGDIPSPADPGWIAYLRATLACGGYAIDGCTLIDGQPAIKIIPTPRNIEYNDPRETFFVSPDSYLPVREVTPYGQVDFRWLAPTAANVNLLNVVVPAGFTQVPPPHSALP